MYTRSGWASILALGFLGSMAARADSISPLVFSGTVAVGGSVTVNKTVTITQQLTTPLDIMFLIDSTGSMAPAISAVSSGFSSIVSTISGLAPNVTFGLADYKDNGDPYVYRTDANIGSTNAAVQAALGALFADGGGDGPESNLYSLQQAAMTASWRSGSQRFIVWVGDAPGHDPSGPTNVTEAQAIAALNAASVNVFAASAMSINAYTNGLDGVCDSNPCGTPNQAQRIAAATLGADLGAFNTAAMVTAIENSILTTIQNYSTVSLSAVGAPAGVTVNLSPAITGSFDRSTTRTFSFTADFTGTAPGTYDFAISALLDGRSVATETDHLTVGGVPEPATVVLFGSGLASCMLASLLRSRRRRANS